MHSPEESEECLMHSPEESEECEEGMLFPQMPWRAKLVFHPMDKRFQQATLDF